MKIDFSWQKNKKSLIAVITGLAILTAVNVFDLGMIGGLIVGAVVGGGMFFLFGDKKNSEES